MKKWILLMLLCLMALMLAGCAASSADGAVAAATEEPLVPDLDLSKLSRTVVYSQVYNMMAEPDASGRSSKWPAITARMRTRNAALSTMPA